MPVIINGNSIDGVLEANVAGPDFAVPFSMIDDLSGQISIIDNSVNIIDNSITIIDTSINNIENQITIIDNSINIIISGGGGSGGFSEASFNELFHKKPDFVTDASGRYDLVDQRVELVWTTPPQERAAFNYISNPNQDRRTTNILTPALPETGGTTGQAPYYPAGPAGTVAPKINLITPSKSTGYYTTISSEPGFSDLNFLPYHQYLGVDYRINSGGTISSWQQITPSMLGFKGNNNLYPGEQYLWYQTRGLFIQNGAGGSTQGNGDYSPNVSGTNKGDFIYELAGNSIFAAGGDRYQFRIYLTNNSDEVLTSTSQDQDFDSENPPYWRYTYIPDVSTNFISFGSMGNATPPRNISNGFKTGGTQSDQPANTPGSFTGIPSQTYRTLTITGGNNNANPFVDPSGSPAATISDASPADASLSIPFTQLTTYSVTNQFLFDISASYQYPAPAAANLSAQWGEQNFPPSQPIAPSLISLSSNANLTKNSWSVAADFPNTNNPSVTGNTYIRPGCTYTLSNYRMKLNGPVPNTEIVSEMYTPGGGGDSVGNAAVPYRPIVIKPPSRQEASTEYRNYLTNTALFNKNSFSVVTNPAFVEPPTVYPGNSSSPFPNAVFFFEPTTNYTFPLNAAPRKCANNKNNSTLGWVDGTAGEIRIGKDLGTPLQDPNGTTIQGLTRFTLETGSNIIQTSYSEGWTSLASSAVGNATLSMTASEPKEAYTATSSGIEFERLRGWYLGRDLTAASATNVTLANYPDICNNSYQPYRFTLKQELNTSFTASPNPIQVGSSSIYDLYIAKVNPNDIIWTPTPFTPITIQTTPELFGINRPTNNIIAQPNNFTITGVLSDIDLWWRPDNTIMEGEVKYYKTSGTQTLQNGNNTFTEPWAVPQTATQNISENLQVTKGDLQQNSMNYSRDNTANPQFRVSGTFKNNVARQPTSFSYPEYQFTLVGGLPLWWDYTYSAFTSLTLSNTGIDSAGGFYPDNPTGTNGFFNAYDQTVTLPDNQLMWANGSYRAAGISQSSSNNPYIDYSVFHNQSQNYAPKKTTGESLSISYTPFGQYYRDDPLNPPNPPATTTISGTYKWINLKVVKQSAATNFITVTVSSGSTLTLGTDYMLFICEKAAFTATESPYTNRSGWKDAARLFDPSLSGTVRNANGTGINTTPAGSSPQANGGPLNIFKNNQTNLEMYLRVGLKNSSTTAITNVSVSFTT